MSISYPTTQGPEVSGTRRISDSGALSCRTGKGMGPRGRLATACRRIQWTNTDPLSRPTACGGAGQWNSVTPVTLCDLATLRPVAGIKCEEKVSGALPGRYK
jgi:hypothetical protein